MKEHRRIGTDTQNCITLNQNGVFEKGIVLDGCLPGSHAAATVRPCIDLKQGVQHAYKGVWCSQDPEYRQGERVARMYNATHVHTGDGAPIMMPERDGNVILYIPSCVDLSFGGSYPSPLELVEGPVVYHPKGRVCDGNYVLGEAWEDDKTAVIVLSSEMKVMMANRMYDEDKGYYVKVVTIVRTPHFLIMRHPSKVEMAWFSRTMKDIRSEEHKARMDRDGVYRSRHG